MKFSTVIVDLDDTLIPNAYSYFIPQLDVAKLICLDLLWHAPSPVAIIQRATELQVAQIRCEQKIDKGNFPNSYITAYKEFCEKANRAVNPNIVAAIAMAAQKYFLQTYSLYPYVKETLTRIKSTKILFTRGDFDIQTYKIENTGLAAYFDYIEIVDLKDVTTYQKIIDKYHLNPHECAMVGDSILNDVNPALATGMHSFHLRAHENDWETAFDNNLPANFEGNYTSLHAFEEILKHLD